jgi:DNA-binding MarR family transcriptional regulator
LSRLYDRHLARAGVNIQQLTILSMIRHKPGVLIADLASQMLMERTTLLRALRPLQKAGFVESEPAGTGRSLALTVSQQGQQKMRDAFPLWQNAQAEVDRLFGIQKANNLRKALRDVSTLA